MGRYFRKRLHLYEFGDQSWLRGWLREAYNDGLNMGKRAGRHYEDMSGPYCDWAQASGVTETLDLASGGGG